MPETSPGIEGVLSISSRVSSGAVGNRLVELAFARLAPRIPVYTIDTVQWTGPGDDPRRNGPVLSGGDLYLMLRILLDSPASGGKGLRRLMTGYLRTPEQVEAVATALDEVPELDAVIVDPVIGDEEKLFVSPETARAIRTRLVPRAHYLLPNLTEAHYLVSQHPKGSASAVALLEQLSGLMPKYRGVVVKSVPMDARGKEEPHGKMIGVLGTEGGEPVTVCGERLTGTFHGTGDLFAGVFAACLFAGGEMDFHHPLLEAHEMTHRALGAWVRGSCRNLAEAFLTLSAEKSNPTVTARR